MRIIKQKTLYSYCHKPKYLPAKQSLLSWIYEARNSTWKNSHELKSKFKSASVITSKRVVFNIKGNQFRLVVDIEYSLEIIFIVWFGTHEEYDKINVKSIQYEH